jgi:hypothetical protein
MLFLTHCVPMFYSKSLILEKGFGMKLQSMFLSLVLIVGLVNVLKAGDPADKKQEVLDDVLQKNPYTLAIVKGFIEKNEAQKKVNNKGLIFIEGDGFNFVSGATGGIVVVDNPQYLMPSDGGILLSTIFLTENNKDVAKINQKNLIFLNGKAPVDQYTVCVINNYSRNDSIGNVCSCMTDLPKLLNDPKIANAFRNYFYQVEADKRKNK